MQDGVHLSWYCSAPLFGVAMEMFATNDDVDG